jgi:hypothetical protein
MVASMSCGLVARLRLALVSGVELFHEHAFVDRTDRVLWPAEHLSAVLLRQLKGKLCHRPAGAPRNARGAVGDFVAALLLAPLLGAIGVVDRHAHHGNRGVHPADSPDAGEAPARAQYHLAVDGFAQDGVRRAHVALAFGRNRRRLKAQAGGRHRGRRLAHHGVVAGPALLQRQVEVGELRRHTSHLGRQDAQTLQQQLLAALVARDHDDRSGWRG